MKSAIEDNKDFQNYSWPAGNNRSVILEKLKALFDQAGDVLEIGSGSAQHAIYFTEQLPHLNWQCSDRGEYLPGLIANIKLLTPGRLNPPIALDVAAENWPTDNVDYVFSANSLHIMSERHVQAFFEGVGKVLKNDGLLVIYGPFKYKQAFTTESNADFDVWLKSRDPKSGIRDIETIIAHAASSQLHLRDDFSMPANNQLLVFQRQG